MFTEYNQIVQEEKKIIQNNVIKLSALHDENTNQINALLEKKRQQQIQLDENFNLVGLKEERSELVNQGIALKNKKADLKKERENKDREYDLKIQIFKDKMTEAATLGKQAKNHYNTFKSGICPTCGQKIDQAHIDEYKNKMEEYAKIYRENEAEKNKLEIEKQQTHD